MNISEVYDLSEILRNLEATLQISGTDYGERDVDVIIENVYKRIYSQYHLDLKQAPLNDESWMLGNKRSDVKTLIDNLSLLHAKLSGYCECIRYKRDTTGVSQEILVRARNINYCGASAGGFFNFLKAVTLESQINTVGPAFQYIKNKLQTINMCYEKRMLLIMIVSRELGVSEIASACAEIFCIGELIS
jgi:hypothetical protein